jgi:hypothetical protein
VLFRSQQLTRTKQGSRGKKEESKKDAKGDLGLISGTTQIGRENTTEMTEGYSRIFDPYWANARAFLDYLSENRLLQRNIEDAQIGQFVLVKGFLSILDLAMLKEVWSLPSVQKRIREGDAPAKPASKMTSSEKSELRTHKNNVNLALDLFPMMPHSVHALLVTSSDDPKLFWCSLRDEHLITPASEVVLAHGPTMPGEWSMVGILNAQPEYLISQPGGDDAEPGLINSIVGQVSKQIAPVIRVTFGRPAAAAAITPLLLFREISQSQID